MSMQNQCAELKLRAERRAGELLASQVEMGRPKKVCPAGTLSDIGVSRKQSSNWQRIASLPEEEFEEYIAEAHEALSRISTTQWRTR